MVRIITDTASDYDAQEYRLKNTDYIPLSVSFGDRSYMETQELDKQVFYKLLTTSQEHPRTSQPSPALLAGILRNAKEQGDEVVCIFLSSSLSGFYNGALLSKELAEMEQCYIIDSGTASAGQRLLIEYAIKLRDAGKSAAEISDAVNRLSRRISVYACLDSIEYLYRGGRISREARLLGTVLNIKPVIRLQRGQLTIAAKARGMKRSIETLCGFFDSEKADPDFPVLMMYTHTLDNVFMLMEKLRVHKCISETQNLFNVGAVIGSHIGPNACGIAFVRSAECS